jgi:thiol-disulfide isomerase/thioredoxin
VGVVHVASTQQYEALKAARDRLIVVDFSAEWCGPCKAIAPEFEKLAKATPTATFLHVDVDHVKVSDAADVRGIPTFKFYVNGELMHSFSGASVQNLQAAVATLGPKAVAKPQAAPLARKHPYDGEMVFGLTLPGMRRSHSRQRTIGSRRCSKQRTPPRSLASSNSSSKCALSDAD